MATNSNDVPSICKAYTPPYIGVFPLENPPAMIRVNLWNQYDRFAAGRNQGGVRKIHSDIFHFSLELVFSADASKYHNGQGEEIRVMHKQWDADPERQAGIEKEFRAKVRALGFPMDDVEMIWTELLRAMPVLEQLANDWNEKNAK